jgi:hypothetical protein
MCMTYPLFPFSDNRSTLKSHCLSLKILKLMSIFKTRSQMADEYSIHRKTFERKLKQAGIILPSGDISPNDQLRIYEHFGYPPGIVRPIPSSSMR